MACNGCGNCEAIGLVEQWENARPSLNERLHALCREIPPTAPEFADIEARLHAVYRGFVPGNDEVLDRFVQVTKTAKNDEVLDRFVQVTKTAKLDRFVQVTKTAKNDGVPLFATECIGVALGLALNYGLSVETRKTAMTLFCDIYEAATL